MVHCFVLGASSEDEKDWRYVPGEDFCLISIEAVKGKKVLYRVTRECLRGGGRGIRTQMVTILSGGAKFFNRLCLVEGMM
ncbi:hypothetical protein E2C01_039510 [Portunus trituberculatus]|uniref:Uncharacterized protein n=1 Tax=Portunus trituberculatus TaxID=210409 RepID=A0A5B7FJW9_PORTR|nr:hypothetical protein [Portunus trituberculatus]